MERPEGFVLADGIRCFPVWHCGARILNTPATSCSPSRSSARGPAGALVAMPSFWLQTASPRKASEFRSRDRRTNSSYQ
jgi:hypothetical protein